MKYILNGFLIVEGKSDIAFLSSFLDCEIVQTYGYKINKEDILYIKELSKKLTPIILTDPDNAGEDIRNRLSKEINGVIIIANKPSGKHHKYGIAESNKEDILTLLKSFITNKKIYSENIKIKDFLDVDSIYYKDIKTHFNLGICNTKGMIKRLNYLSISIKDIKMFVETLKSGN